MAIILLTNDDGIEAEGLQVLEESIGALAQIVVVAPDREKSAVSHGLTVHDSLEARQVRADHYSINGTPADCVIYALSRILPVQPVLVISGINHGANLGDDIMYSGTVAGAREASRRGIPALAVSQAYEDRPVRFHKAGKFVKTLVRTMLAKRSDGGIFLNVNIPVRRIRGVKITRQGCALHFPHFNSLERRSGEGETMPVAETEASRSSIPLDFQAVWEGFVSITPLQRDQTDYATADQLLKEGQLIRRFRLPGMGLIG